MRGEDEDEHEDEEENLSEFLLNSGMASVATLGQSYGVCRDLLYTTAGSLAFVADDLDEYPPELVAKVFKSWIRQQADRADRAAQEITDNVVHHREQPDFTRCMALTGTLFDFDMQMTLLLNWVKTNHEKATASEEETE
jgi:hypothetical protein